MPMGGGGGGQKQNDRKAKRFQQEAEALYVENRAWTAAIIGNRRRNEAADQ